jgi:UDP-N-acetylglucosamine--N-acetylmuramyl-(pentapeptide) pyrophosphoryl-undecaprenol N-acetylglucosamine transferase
VLLFEPNAQAGSANRWLSRFSHGVFVGYDEAAAELACRTWFTGIPVRSEFHRAGEAPVPSGERRILVVGGSQGALQINQLIPAVCELLADRVDRLRVLHQTGRKHLENVSRDYEQRSLAGIVVEVVPFIDDMASAMRASRLVVSRAGALTLAEIAAAARPSVLIPLTHAGRHQYANAEHLVRAGAAEMLPREDATPERLSEVLLKLLTDGERCQRMGMAARQLAHPTAAETIADVVESVGGAG